MGGTKVLTLGGRKVISQSFQAVTSQVWTRRVKAFHPSIQQSDTCHAVLQVFPSKDTCRGLLMGYYANIETY